MTCSSTLRRFARSATQTCCSDSAEPLVLDLLRALSAHAHERPLDRADDLREVDLLGRLREPVAALGTALAAHHPGGAQLREDVLQERHRNALAWATCRPCAASPGCRRRARRRRARRSRPWRLRALAVILTYLAADGAEVELRRRTPPGAPRSPRLGRLSGRTGAEYGERRRDRLHPRSQDRLNRAAPTSRTPIRPWRCRRMPGSLTLAFPRHRCARGNAARSRASRDWQDGPFLISAAPGAGKTRPALEFASELLSRRAVRRVVVLCPTTPLTRQWAAAAAILGVQLQPDAPGPNPPRDFHGVAVTYARVASDPARRGRRRCDGHARDRRRGAPSRRRPRLGDGLSTSVRRRPALAAALRAPPFAPTRRRSRACATTPRGWSSPTSPTPTPRPSPTGSVARSRS